VKILPVTLFIEFFAAFSKSPTTLKMLPETACDVVLTIVPKAARLPDTNHSDAAFGTETTSHRFFNKKIFNS
jgi:hypothetical protein